MGSLQSHKFLAVTIFLMSSTFHCSSGGPFLLVINFFNALSPENEKQY